MISVKREGCVNEQLLPNNRSPDLKDVMKKATTGEVADCIVGVAGRSVRIMTSPVSVEDKLKGTVMLMIDVTENQQAEMIRKEFSANVSHELKTPLMSICGYAEIIQNGLAKSEDIPEFSKRIFDEATRLTRLVEDIIKLSRLDENNIKIDDEEVDLYDLAKHIRM